MKVCFMLVTHTVTVAGSLWIYFSKKYLLNNQHTYKTNWLNNPYICKILFMD